MLNRYFKKKSTKRRLTMTTLKTSSTIFPVKVVLIAALIKKTISDCRARSYELARASASYELA